MEDFGNFFNSLNKSELAHVGASAGVAVLVGIGLFLVKRLFLQDFLGCTALPDIASAIIISLVSIATFAAVYLGIKYFNFRKNK